MKLFQKALAYLNGESQTINKAFTPRNLDDVKKPAFMVPGNCYTNGSGERLVIVGQNPINGMIEFIIEEDDSNYSYSSIKYAGKTPISKEPDMMNDFLSSEGWR